MYGSDVILSTILSLSRMVHSSHLSLGRIRNRQQGSNWRIQGVHYASVSGLSHVGSSLVIDFKIGLHMAEVLAMKIDSCVDCRLGTLGAV